MSKEIWKEIKGYEGYYSVSNKGRVKSLDRVVNHGVDNLERIIKGRILTEWVSGGYPHASMSLNGEVKKERIHRLVATAFIPNPENKYTVNHIDGDKTNNKVENLEWATLSENNKHAYDTGLYTTFGENQPNSKLTVDEVIEIREKYEHREDHETYTYIAKKYGISRRSLTDVLKYKSWKNLDKSRLTEV